MNSDGSGGGSVPGELAQASRDSREPFTHLPPRIKIKKTAIFEIKNFLCRKEKKDEKVLTFGDGLSGS